MTKTTPENISTRLRLLLEMGPLVFFFLAYAFHTPLAAFLAPRFAWMPFTQEGQAMLFALCFFLPLQTAGTLLLAGMERRIRKLALFTLVMALLFGGLTLMLRARVFFYIKPTIVYGLLCLFCLLVSFFYKRLGVDFFEGAFRPPPHILRKFLRQTSLFFLVLAITNEIAWRFLTSECDLSDAYSVCEGEKIWITIKIFGYGLLVFAYSIMQAMRLARYADTQDNTDD